MKKSIYVYNEGELLRRDNTLKFVPEDGSSRYIPIEAVSDIYLMCEMQFNTNLINFLSQQNVSIHFFNYYDFYTGTFYPREKFVSGELLVRQVEHYLDAEKRLQIAQKFIDAAAINIYRNLRYYNARGKNVCVQMKKINDFHEQLFHTKTVDELMGIEGNIRKTYYTAWNTIVDQEINFDKRVKHPPDNMINSLISFVNTLVYTKILGEIYQTQLNPMVSYLHVPGTRRFSLCLDIAEVFKPIIADRLIFTLLNKRQITEKSFTKELNYLHLKKEASKLIVSQLDNRLKTTIKYKELGKEVSYQYLMRLECYKLIKHLLGEKTYVPYKIQ